MKKPSTSSPLSEVNETTAEIIDAIIDIAMPQVTDAGRAGATPEARERLRHELIAIYRSEYASELPLQDRAPVPPWIRFPDAFSSRVDFVEQTVEATETSCFLESFPLDAPIEEAKRKVRVLAHIDRDFPDA